MYPGKPGKSAFLLSNEEEVPLFIAYLFQFSDPIF
jgi:hypothetical protein